MSSSYNNENHSVQKRNGTYEQYSVTKLRNVILWAAEGSEVFTDAIMDALQIRVYDRIPITTLFDEVIDTTYNMISRLHPQYEPICKRLYLQKMYKQTWSMNRNMYPHVREYLTGISSVTIDVLSKFTTNEINQLSSAIKPERDMRSTYLGLQTFFDKYSMKVNGQPVELLQHGYLRLAIQAYINDTSNERIQKIINRYNNLSLSIYTESTPKWKNSLRPKYQAASCCVHKMDDNTESINKVVSDVGQYSRFDGGNAADVSALRCAGSLIGTKGHSAGPIPFIRKLQSSVEAFNQSSTRPGICIVTYAWWHADIFSLLKLMDEGGNENQRARNLKFTLKVNTLLLDAVKTNEDVHLFDPKDVPELLESYGEEFNKLYKQAILDGKSKQIVPARTIALELATQRSETGNLYLFFSDNVNKQSPFKDIIHSSNACTEIFLPTYSSSNTTSCSRLSIGASKYITTMKETSGLTALCNLSSINVYAWMNLSKAEQHAVAKELLEASDNQIDDQYYPTVDGEIFNRNYRAIGIGENNLAYYFAKHNIKFSSKEALEHQELISKSIHDVFNEESAKLATIRGDFPWIKKTHLTNRRFATLFAIAPTSTSSLIGNLTEGIEPVERLISEKTGTYSTKQVAPELATIGMNYELANDVPTKSLYDLAAVRQRYLDQGQSINTYPKDNSSAYEIISDIIYADDQGLNSLYYLKSVTTQICEGCES